jgi:glycosyltransferase involved in cell wall biosynthesis
MTAQCDGQNGTAASIIISNFNYDEFLRAAIDSALAVDWPRLQVIVVDDGSSDTSRDIIRSYGEKIVAIFQENGGQQKAYAAGFAASSGDMLIFLDSDDLLAPTILREAAQVWRPTTSKVQVQMQVINR